MLENNPVLLNSLFFALMAAVALLLIFLVVKGILASRRWKSALEAPITEEFATVVGKEETEKTRRAMGLTSFEAERVTGYLVTFLRERDDIRQTVPVEESFTMPLQRAIEAFCGCVVIPSSSLNEQRNNLLKKHGHKKSGEE